MELKAFKLDPTNLKRIAREICEATGYGLHGCNHRLMAESCTAGTILGTEKPKRKNAIGMAAINPLVIEKMQRCRCPRVTAALNLMQLKFSTDLREVSLYAIDSDPVVELQILRAIIEMHAEHVRASIELRAEWYSQYIALESLDAVRDYEKRTMILGEPAW